MNASGKIYSSRCWYQGNLLPATVCYEAGKITGIFFEKLPGATDAGEALLMPGVIDAHVHINEPGRTNWEGFDTGTRAAAAGGTTSLADMPLNANPVTTTEEALLQKLNSTQNKLHTNVGFYAGLVPGNAARIPALCKMGVLGVKAFLTHSGIDEFPNVTEKDLEIAMPLIRDAGSKLLVHAELSDDTTTGLLSNNPFSYQAYVASRPKIWENRAIEMMIHLCRKHRCPVHIVHVSSAEALPLIAAAKSEGLPLTAETCAHYIYFNAGMIPDAQPVYKCAPPIREKENNEQLKAALQSGILDFLTTDHSPAPPGIKAFDTGNLQKAWGGIAGLQFLLSAGWSALQDVLSLEEYIPLVTTNPARFLGLQESKGLIEIGADADFVIWQPEINFTVEPSQILHRYKDTAYAHQKLYGKIVKTIINGITVYEHHKIINLNAGTWLLKK